MPSGCNVCNLRIQKLSLFCLWWFSFQLRLWSMITNFDLTRSSNECPGDTKCSLAGKSVFFVRSMHSFVEWLDTFSYVLRSADVAVKEVNHIRCFAIDIAKYFILLSCRLPMEHLCVLQLETAFATLVTTWFTLADRRWRSRYRSSDQCILNAFRSPERYNGQLGQHFTFFNFFPRLLPWM
jgi:hypothetical protein